MRIRRNTMGTLYEKKPTYSLEMKELKKNAKDDDSRKWIAHTDKENFPIKCFHCGISIKVGFICEISDKTACVKCHQDPKKEMCGYTKNHEHLKVEFKPK